MLTRFGVWLRKSNSGEDVKLTEGDPGSGYVDRLGRRKAILDAGKSAITRGRWITRRMTIMPSYLKIICL